MFTPSSGGSGDALSLPIPAGRVGALGAPCRPGGVDGSGGARTRPLTERHPDPRVHESGMRAPAQKTRPRRPGKQPTPTGDAEQTPTVGRGRPTHVRNRLIVAVAVVAAAIAGAGAPGVLAASAELSDSQDLVTLAEQTQDALSLAHSLADERDEVTSYIAAGRPRSKAPSEQHSARVDRQVEEMRADS